MAIGGVAMILHGSSHITQDLDILYARDPENLAALVRALSPVHPRLRGVAEHVPFRWDAHTLRLGSNFTLSTDDGPIDLLGHAAGCPDFERAHESAVEFQVGESVVLVASLDDLISMKKAANRPKDKVHLMELEALQKLSADG